MNKNINFDVIDNKMIETEMLASIINLEATVYFIINKDNNYKIKINSTTTIEYDINADEIIIYEIGVCDIFTKFIIKNHKVIYTIFDKDPYCINNILSNYDIILKQSI